MDDLTTVGRHACPAVDIERLVIRVDATLFVLGRVVQQIHHTGVQGGYHFLGFLYESPRFLSFDRTLRELPAGTDLQTRRRIADILVVGPILHAYAHAFHGCHEVTDVFGGVFVPRNVFAHRACKVSLHHGMECVDLVPAPAAGLFMSRPDSDEP